MAYRGFLRKGFQLTAVFDTDAAKHGQEFGDLRIRPMAELAAVAEQQGIRLAILAVPAEAAQEVARQLVAVGVRGILNFAPLSISVPDGVSVQSVDLAVQLEQLAFKMSLTGTESPPPGANP